VREFMAAIERMHAQQRIGAAVAARMAQAEAKAFSGYVKALEGGTDGS